MMLTKKSRSGSGDTWSIIVIDPETREVGVAGASCTNNCSEIGSILPGIGAIVVQAKSNDNARDKGLELMASGGTPEQIMAVLREPRFNPDRQQYGIVTFNHIDAAATYTGKLARLHKGALTAYGISVQGNTLANNQVIHAVLAAALNAREKKQPVDEILMSALEAGAIAGGDKRCGEQKARSAFIAVARPDDPPNRPSLDLQVLAQEKGGPNAVSVLRTKYDQYRSGQAF